MAVPQIVREFVGGAWRTREEVAAGGGSQPVAPVVRGPFLFAFDDVNLAAQSFPITGVDIPFGTFTIAGDHTALFPVGADFLVVGSTGNDQSYTIGDVALDGGNTVITTPDGINDPTVDGDIRNIGTVGVQFYVPTIEDILLDAWIEVDTVWDGSSPKADIGRFRVPSDNDGLFAVGIGPVTMTNAASENAMAGSLSTFQNPSLVIAAGYNGGGAPPLRFTTADPLYVIVTSGGNRIQDDPGSSQGQARLYIVTATPVAFA